MIQMQRNPFIRLPIENPVESEQIVPQNEERIRKLMEARYRQQEKYAHAAKDLAGKIKTQPLAKVEPIIEQITTESNIMPGKNHLVLFL